MINFQLFLSLFITLATSIFFSCAFDLAHVKYDYAVLSPCSENCSFFVIEEDQILYNLPCGYKRTLKKDTKWILLGKIDYGDVYKPINQSFTIECSNVYEAYLVMNRTELKGFYLPVEDGYVHMKKSVKINMH